MSDLNEPMREEQVQCPHCWESFSVLWDLTLEGQNWIEDCAVCCHPIEFTHGPGVDGQPILKCERV